MKKIILLSLLYAIGITTTYSQSVSLKDENILYNNTPILKYKKLDFIEFSIFTLKDDEIIYSKYSDNETPKNYDDDYVIINFLSEKKKIESTKEEKAISGFGANAKKNLIKLLNWLIDEKVLNIDGTINKDKVDIFYQKYDEHITGRTIRSN
jgi:hypothetical protein